MRRFTAIAFAVREARGDATQQEFARALKVSRYSVNQLENSRRAMTADMALRLEGVTGRKAATWMRIQVTEDLARLRARLSRAFPALAGKS